jgi:hypothetical protein
MPWGSSYECHHAGSWVRRDIRPHRRVDLLAILALARDSGGLGQGKRIYAGEPRISHLPQGTLHLDHVQKSNGLLRERSRQQQPPALLLGSLWRVVARRVDEPGGGRMGRPIRPLTAYSSFQGSLFSASRRMNFRPVQYLIGSSQVIGDRYASHLE